MIIEGIPVDSTDPARLYRGYIAVDDIDLQPGTSCIGFCNFAGGFCDWTNDADDDFDWTIVSLSITEIFFIYNINICTESRQWKSNDWTSNG